MASSSAAIRPEERPKKYDVFISFRGEDTRRNFTGHLYHALHREFVTYIDHDLERGDDISPALMGAIEESYLSLIIFSENYASSKWCLDELTKIMECKKFKGQVVIPVFYRIDPSHVRKQLGSYKKAFAKHEKDLKDNKNKMLKWRAALAEAASLVGFDSENYRIEKVLIEEIVKVVEKNLDHVYPSCELGGLVGLQQNFAQMQRLLAINSNDVRIIGIWGIGGIGKTTLATTLFGKYSSQYEGRCFLRNVRTESEKHGLDHLRNKLVSQLLGGDNHEIFTHKELSRIMRKLRSRKVFIVLDDVNSWEQLEYCLVEKHECLGLGSRVILTTRDKHVFSGRVYEYHEVKELNFEYSLQLFSLNAFKKSNPMEGYDELSVRAINYAKGVPLALKVLGLLLRSKSEKEWKSTLEKLEKIPNKDIQNVLKLSYDELDCNEKEIFLDIACIMKGWNKNLVERILHACGFFVDAEMGSLVDKALITVYDNKVEMHDLIQQMGREIVRKKSIDDIGRCSRLWDPKEIDHELRYNKGTDAIQGIVFDKYDEPGDLYLESDVFKKMINLRFLIFQSKKFNLYALSGIESLPSNLRYLHWREYPSKSLPSTFSPEKLVRLLMPNSQLEKLWDGCPNLANLEMIWLFDSPNLLELPDVSSAKNLKAMYLHECPRLREMHPSILSLPKLETLFLSNCKGLKTLKSSVHSRSLEYLHLSGCSSLQEFLVTSEKMRYLDLGFTAIDELPPCILLQKKLKQFSFQVSESLNKPPGDVVKSLSLAGCCEGDLPTLRTVMDGLWYLKELNLSGCTLSELPDNIDRLVSLQLLLLEGSHLVRLPENIKHVLQLECLRLYNCKKLQSLPELPPSITVLDARGCTSLEILLGPSEPPNMNAFYTFENCIKLGQDALDTIMEAANKIMGSQVEELEEGKSDDTEDYAYLYDKEYTKVGFCFPGDKLLDFFSDRSTQPSLTIEIPSSSMLLGFAFCVIIHKADVAFVGLGCECCLVGNNGETIVSFESWFTDNVKHADRINRTEPELDHVYMWYDACHYHAIMDGIEHNRIGCNMKLSFTFLVATSYSKIMAMTPYEVSSSEKEDTNKKVMIKSCGVQPIYVPANHLPVREGESTEINRRMESYELKSPLKITRKAIFPGLSSGKQKLGESKGLKEILNSP